MPPLHARYRLCVYSPSEAAAPLIPSAAGNIQLPILSECMLFFSSQTLVAFKNRDNIFPSLCWKHFHKLNQVMKGWGRDLFYNNLFPSCHSAKNKIHCSLEYYICSFKKKKKSGHLDVHAYVQLALKRILTNISITPCHPRFNWNPPIPTVRSYCG